MMTQEEYVKDAVGLLSQLIATPSTSRNEKDAADIMEKALRNYGFTPHREANNVWVIDPHFDEQKPTLLLNAHIDTREACRFMEARFLCSNYRGRHALRSGQQRLWRRSVLTTADIPDADRENTELQPYLFSIGRRGSLWQRRHQPSLASLAKNRPGYCG